MTVLLNDQEIQAKLASLQGWTRGNETIQTTRTFDGFPEAIAFVNQIVESAEAAGHHPDLKISYNKVTLELSTHDAGGLTQKDFDMAAQIDQIG